MSAAPAILASGIRTDAATQTSPSTPQKSWGARIVEQYTPSTQTMKKWANIAAHIGAIIAVAIVDLALIFPFVVVSTAAILAMPLSAIIVVPAAVGYAFILDYINSQLFDQLHSLINRNIR